MTINNVLTPERILYFAHRIARAGLDERRALVHAIEREILAAQQVTDTARLDWLREECCDLRSVSVPTGGDDYDVHWVVIQHHMDAPHEREIGRGFSDDPRDAIDAARAHSTNRNKGSD